MDSTTAIITFRAPVEVKTALDSIADADERPRAWLLNKIVREWLQTNGMRLEATGK